MVLVSTPECSVSKTLMQVRPTNEHGERVNPSDFEAYRLSHDILAPTCLCPFEDPDLGDFAESAIYMVSYGRYAGEYVAACANDRCGYFGRGIHHLVDWSRYSADWMPSFHRTHAP